MADPFTPKTYYAISLDPVHIGTGGYRLGHVDNTILRESGTNLPKIPGSSLNGVLRAYTAMVVQEQYDTIGPKENSEGLWVIDYEKYRQMKYMRPDYVFIENKMHPSGYRHDPKNQRYIFLSTTKGPMINTNPKTGNKIYLSCAGKGANNGEGHCGDEDCPVCVAFGFSKGDKGSFQGLVQFYDMRILFFPVYTQLGPIWITSPSVLNELNNNTGVEDVQDNEFISKAATMPESLYIGGLKINKSETGSALELNAKAAEHIPKPISGRTIVVSNNCFSRFVNDNLEVRTSVSIDPATGAAVEGALFTYEAIPRSTVMWFDVVYNKPEFFRIKNKSISLKISAIKKNIEKSMAVMKALGIGGMNTRGMGRVEVLNLDI